MMEAKLCLVGAGNMGGALLSGWLEDGYDPGLITVIDPSPPPAMAALIAKFEVAHFTQADDAPQADIIVVAVKPQIMGLVLPNLTHLVNENNVLVSVAAGTTIASLASPFAPSSVRVVRVMPNTPAQVGRGISVCVASEQVDDTQRDDVTTLMAYVGQVEWIEDEALIDAVTGVSGSGPAYVFHLAEALAAAGVKAGLPPELADSLARATVSGAGELMRQSSLTPAQLRENVTSPKGTTAAALNVLMSDDGFPVLLEKAVAAATERSRELAG